MLRYIDLFHAFYIESRNIYKFTRHNRILRNKDDCKNVKYTTIQVQEFSLLLMSYVYLIVAS